MQQNLLKTQNQPTKINPLDNDYMSMEWQDLSQYKLSYQELRLQCPCAGCVDEHTGKRTIKVDDVKKGIKPTGVQLIGRYAVQIIWNDGHSTGMYHFDKLLDLCQNKGTKL